MRKSSKIAFAVSLVAGAVLAACLFAGIVRTVGRDCVVTEIWLPDVLKMKRLFAERTPSPRIIVSAGSGAMFGVDSGVLSETLGLPVVNMALHAALPLEFYCEELRRMARPGDVVVLPLEIENFYDVDFSEKVSRDFPVSMLFGVAPEYANAISAIDLVSLYARYGQEWICRNLRGQTHHAPAKVDDLVREWKASRNCEEYDGYGFAGLSERGDMLVSRPSLPLPDKKWKVPSRLSPSFVATWRLFADDMERRGVTVILTWCNLLWYPEYDSFGDFRNLLAREGIAIHGRPEAFFFPPDCYYDTHFHLNAYGAALNARELAKAVAPLLGRTVRETGDSCAHGAFATCGRECFPMVKNGDVTASGVRLPKGESEMSLSLPVSLKGKDCRLAIVVKPTAGASLMRAECLGKLLRQRKTRHACRDEITLTIPAEMTRDGSVDIRLFMSGPAVAECWTWLGSLPDLQFISGFSGAWTVGTSAEFELAVPAGLRDRDAILQMFVRPSEEQMRVLCGDTVLGQYDLTWDAVDLAVPVPAKFMNGERIRIQLRLSRVKSPKERGWSQDARLLGPRIETVKLKSIGRK